MVAERAKAKDRKREANEEREETKHGIRKHRNLHGRPPFNQSYSLFEGVCENERSTPSDKREGGP